MAFDPNCKQCLDITRFNIPSDNFPAPRLFEEDRKILIRRYATSVIAQVAMLQNPPNAYVPYMAMSYFDRFLSNYHMTMTAEGPSTAEKVSLIAICCFALSADRRISSFSLSDLLINIQREMEFSWMKYKMNYKMASIMQCCIREKIGNKLHPVTAFWFLNHYYAHFKPLGLKRHSINEILVQAQGEHTFIDFMPTDIAFSACVAAATIALEELPEDINQMTTNEVKEIIQMMIELCDRLNILIPKIEVPAEEIEGDPQMEAAISAIEPTEHMDFVLKWITEVPALEEALAEEIAEVPALEEALDEEIVELQPADLGLQGARKVVRVKGKHNLQGFINRTIQNFSHAKLIFKVPVRLGPKTLRGMKSAVKNSNRNLVRADEVKPWGQ